MYQLKCGGLSPYTLEMWWESEIEAPLIKPSSIGPRLYFIAINSAPIWSSAWWIIQGKLFLSVSDDLKLEWPVYYEVCFGS